MARLLLIVGVMALPSCTPQPQHDVSAVVVSMAPRANPRWNANKMVVTIRSPDGAVGSKSILIERLNCRVGDTVRATARGIALALNDGECER